MSGAKYVKKRKKEGRSAILVARTQDYTPEDWSFPHFELTKTIMQFWNKFIEYE
jgi:hypothetical protein